MRVAIIVNPASGSGTKTSPAGAARVELATRLARASGQMIDVVSTNAAGHAAELAAGFVSRGFSRVIAWGGDGTINEIAGPLIGTGTSLGVVPAGSGDGLARGLGVARHLERAFSAALGSSVEPIDVGMLGQRHFLNIGGFGFDAAVAAAFNRRTTRGPRGYVIDFLQGIWSYDSEAYTVDVGGERTTGSCFLVAFANGREYGTGLVLAPDASTTDGELDMVMVSGGRPWRQLWRARRLAYRRMAPAEGVRRARVTTASVTGEALHAHVDGETFRASGTVHVSINPRAILVAGLRATSLLSAESHRRAGEAQNHR